MIINRFKKIDAVTSRQLLSKIQDWKTQFQQINPNNLEEIEKSKNEIAPLLFQALIESDKPLGLYLPKQLFIDALSEQNEANWDFIVCHIGTEEPEVPKMTPKLRPIFKFYKGGKDTDGQFIPITPATLHFSNATESNLQSSQKQAKNTTNANDSNAQAVTYAASISSVGGCANSTPPPR